MVKLLIKFIITVLLTGGIYFCASIYPQTGVLMWFAMLPICLYALSSSLIATVLGGFFAFFLGNAADLFIYWHTIIPHSAFLYPAIIDTVAYTVLLVIFRFVAIRSKHWSASFVFASGWVTYNFISFTFFPYLQGATYSNIAYTQLLDLPVIQLASVTGIWGITFLLILLPTSIALAWHYKKIARFSFKALLLPLVLFMLVTSFGMYRLSTPLPNTTVKIGIAAPRVSREELIAIFGKFTNKASQVNFDIIKRSIKDIKSLAKFNVEVVLLPEVLAIIPEQDKNHILKLLSDTARRNKITLIIGLITRENNQSYNSAYMFLPNGKIALRHDKWHLVPGVETNSFVPGNKLSILPTNKGNWGILICRDMDYEQPARQYGEEGVNLLFVPAWDFDNDYWVHGRYAYMRAVENGFALARAGQEGLLTLSDSRGRMINTLLTTTATDKQILLTGSLNIGESQTFYSKYGDWFAWGCLIIFLINFVILCKNIIFSHPRKD